MGMPGAGLQVQIRARRLQIDAGLQLLWIEAGDQNRPDFQQRPFDQQRIRHQQGQCRGGRRSTVP